MTTSKERPRDAQPTDLELMLYFDGELEEPRKSAVAAFIAADLGAQNKLAGLQITSGFLQAHAHDLAPEGDIAALVLAKIEAETPAEKPAPTTAQGAKILQFPGTPAHRAAATSTNRAPAPLRQRPANDYARRIVGVAALAVAAAAALAIWGKTTTGSGAGPQTGPVAVTTPSSAPSPQASPGSPSSTQPQVDVASVAPEGDVEHGVEVAAVNFGAHMGSIFYVPSGSIEANHTTTVVWLADDAGE